MLKSKEDDKSDVHRDFFGKIYELKHTCNELASLALETKKGILRNSMSQDQILKNISIIESSLRVQD